MSRSCAIVSSSEKFVGGLETCCVSASEAWAIIRGEGLPQRGVTGVNCRYKGLHTTIYEDHGNAMMVVVEKHEHKRPKIEVDRRKWQEI